MTGPRGALRVLLTGASGGIGAALAHALAREGASLLLHGRDETALARHAADLPTAGDVRTVAADLAQPAGRAALVAAAHAFPGGVDTVIHNAGWNRFALLADHSEQQLEQTLAINLTVPLLLTRALLPALLERPRARLVFVGSAFGAIGYPGYAPYCAAKFGLRGLAEALRRELADTRVRVLHVSPRATDTALNSGAARDMLRALKSGMDAPATVAAAVLEALRRDTAVAQVGWPEKLFARVNGLLPELVDRVLARQLPTIKQCMERKE